MTLLERLRHRREDILRIVAKHGAFNVRVFGSVARGEAEPESDIDFLIEKGQTTSSWFPAGLVLDLEELLDRRVEIVTETALNQYVRERVLGEAIPI